jgi:PAS domain S-box-containing protein
LENDSVRPDNDRSATADEYRLLVESVIGYAIYLLDTEGRVVSWNAGAERIKGYCAEEVIGTHFSRFYPAEAVAARNPEQALRVAAEKGRFQEEGWRVRKDGSRFWANVLITALRGPDGKLRGFGKVTRDLTEMKKAEATAGELNREQAARAAAEQAETRIRESEERYRQLSRRLEIILEAVADGIIVQDPTGRVIYTNTAAARLSGYATPEAMARASASEILAKFETLDEQGQPISRDELPGRMALRGIDPAPKVMRIKDRQSGQAWWTLLKASVVRDTDGKPELAVSIWHDITASRRQEEAALFLAKATATLSISLDYPKTLAALAESMVPALADWCSIDLVEEGELRLLALAHSDPAKAAKARELREGCPPDLGAPRGLANVLRSGCSELYVDRPPPLFGALDVRSAMVVPIKGRERTLGAMTMVMAESGRAYDEQDLALAEELGRRAGSAIENARLYEDAQRAVRLRDDFLSIAGHELRTPLTALDLHLHSLASAFAKGSVVNDPQRWYERLKKTMAQSRRLGRLIRELLDVSRITSGRIELEREEVDLAQLTAEIVDRHAGELAREGSVVEFRHTGPTVGSWDRSRLDQVISNLLGNAIKYGAGKPIQIRVTGSAKLVMLEVEDQGIGVAPEFQDRIFERFGRGVSERNYGGLGLGLWIVREIVHTHGGTVRVESRPGCGSTFTVELPR